MRLLAFQPEITCGQQLLQIGRHTALPVALQEECYILGFTVLVHAKSPTGIDPGTILEKVFRSGICLSLQRYYLGSYRGILGTLVRTACDQSQRKTGKKRELCGPATVEKWEIHRANDQQLVGTFMTTFTE